MPDDDFERDRQIEQLASVLIAIEDSIAWLVENRGMLALDIVRHLVEAEHHVVIAGAELLGFDFDLDENDLANVVNNLFADKGWVLVEVRAFKDNVDLMDFLLDSGKKVRMHLVDQAGAKTCVAIRRERGSVFRVEWNCEIAGKPQVELAPVHHLLGLIWYLGKPDLTQVEVWDRVEERP